MSSWDSSGFGGETFAAGAGRSEAIELVGPHLRVSGNLNLGRFGRLSDLVNHSRGFVRLHDARLLRRNGDPTSLIVPELMVNQDEITFIGQAEHLLAEAPTEEPDGGIGGGGIGGGGIGGGGIGGSGPTGLAGPMTGERPSIEKAPRRFVIFTPGHAITGLIHVHSEMTLPNFVEASEPRFVPMTAVSARSLADRRVISHFEFLLVNRTQMTAIAEMDSGSKLSEAVSEVQAG